MPKIKIPGLPAEPGDMGGNFYDGPVPPAGMYHGKVKRLVMKTNQNGDYMLNGLVEIAEPKGSKSFKYNGYGIWFNQNMTEQGAPYLNAFLNAIGAKYKDVVAGNMLVNDDDPPKVMKIGMLKITDENPIVVVTRRNEWNGQDRLEITRYMAPKNADEDEDDEDIEEIEDEDLEDEDVDEDEDEEADDDVEDDDEDEADEDEEDDEDEEADDEEAYTREELEGMAVLELKGILKEAGWTVADYKGFGKDDLISAILGDEDEGDDEPPF